MTLSQIAFEVEDVFIFLFELALLIFAAYVMLSYRREIQREHKEFIKRRDAFQQAFEDAAKQRHDENA